MLFTYDAVTMLEEDDFPTVIEVTRNLLAAMATGHAGASIGPPALDVLAHLLEGISAGRWRPNSKDDLEELAGRLLPVLRAAYRNVPSETLGRGNVATHLVGFGMKDEEQALRVAEAAKL